MKRKSIILAISIVAIIAIGSIILKSCRSSKNQIQFQTTTVTLGKISNSVTATGTIQAIKTVAVGTQVSGVIKKLYVDFNSTVKKGQILAKIDETPLIATLEQSKSAVESAAADLKYKKANYDRLKALFEKKLIAKADYDEAVSNYDQAKSSLASAKSNYDRNKINLEYATIYSPIDGVVLNRAVDEGQTVASSFSTPTLFSIANDLTQMRVEANVDEADIGKVKDGQRVEFTVDAYQDTKFTGKVTQVRLQPTVTSNVVTYTVIIEAPNPDKKLMPGMTANASIFTDEANDLLILDNKALRFTPDSKLMAQYIKDFPQIVSSKINQELRKKTPTNENSTTVTLWIKKGTEIVPITATTGISDEINIEIKSGVSAGDEVIYAMQSATISDTATTSSSGSSPFMPKRPSEKSKKK